MLVLLFVCLSLVSANFNGTWQLDQSASQSSYDMLIAMGMSGFKAGIASRLMVNEEYRIYRRSIYIHRWTNPRYSNTEMTYYFGDETKINDVVLGEGVSIMRLENGKLDYSFRRNNDGALFHSLRELLQPNRMKISFTYSGLSQGTFTQYFNRQ